MVFQVIADGLTLQYRHILPPDICWDAVLQILESVLFVHPSSPRVMIRNPYNRIRKARDFLKVEYQEPEYLV